MANTQALKARVRSVKSTKQITKAMQLVAASKMRRAQEATKASAPYSQAAQDLLSALASHNSVKDHPLFEQRTIKSRLIIVIASDKGLAGAFNSNLLRVYANELKDDVAARVQTSSITIGRKASQFASRIKGTNIIGVYQDLADKPDSRELYTILDTARDLFVAGEIDAVDVIYTKYISGAVQRAETVRVLPAGVTDEGEPAHAAQDVVYEPNAHEVLNGVTYRLIGAQLYQALLESRASEYSMRMVAMKNATDNASDLIDDLTLEMNKARQGAITQELAEISGGVEALND
jgi:F-type H+-transporting ATPase subunit gamma